MTPIKMAKQMEVHVKTVEGHPAIQATDQIVSPNVTQEIGLLRSKFEGARPFRHVVVEGFFKPDFAEALLRDFPAFDPRRAVNEFGEMGNKAVNERIETLSPAYAAVSDYLKSEAFLKLMRPAFRTCCPTSTCTAAAPMKIGTAKNSMPTSISITIQ